MKLPEDPFMLLSFINMKLRDEEYEDFNDLCRSLDCDGKQLEDTLREAGFTYNPDIKQFR